MGTIDCNRSKSFYTTIKVVYSLPVGQKTYAVLTSQLIVLKRYQFGV